MVSKETVARYGHLPPVPDKLHLMMPQEGVRHSVVPCQTQHNAIWDYVVSPEGRHFFSLCAEGNVTEYPSLYEYLPETGTFKLCFRFEDVVICQPRAMPASKFHTSMAFLPDGRLIMSTHLSAIGRGHPEVLPFAYYNHQWEGYAGSNVLIYDPADGRVENLGVSVPRDTVYGGAYDPASNAYYFGTHMRGHIYKLGLDGRQVKDYGQYAEKASFRYILGPDQNVYFSTKTGAFMRVNTREDRVEDLHIQFPFHKDAPYAQNQLAYGTVGPDGKMYLSSAYGDLLMRYDIASNALESLGGVAPPDFYGFPWRLQFADGLAFDKFGVLWYVFYAEDTLCWLTSWDVLGGGVPICHGVLGTPERSVFYASEIHIAGDVLYAADTNHSYDPPAILSIPLDSVRRGAGQAVKCRDAFHYVCFTDGAERFDGDIAAEGERLYRDILLRNDQTSEFWKENPHVFMTDSHYLTKIWKRIPVEESSVSAVRYDSEGNIHAYTGGQPAWHVLIRHGEVISAEKCDGVPETAQDTAIFDGIKLPSRPGKQFMAKASACAPMSEGRHIVGTQDGLLALVKDGKAFSLGACAPHGPVHQLAVTRDGRVAYGVAGDPSDLGMVFSYDDENGLITYGCLRIYNSVSLGSSCEPCCVALSEDDRWLAIGVRDRLGCVYEYDLSGGIHPVAIF